MHTYTQDFTPYGSRTATERHSEGKAAARRRRQMERQASKQRIQQAAVALLQMGTRLVAEVEEAQAQRLAERMEAFLALPKPKRDIHAQLAEWFERWRNPIRSWFRGKASVPPGDIDDLAQEVFLRLLRYPDAALAVNNPQGYLFRIASNVVNEWHERSRNAKPHEADWLDDIVMDSEQQPEVLFERLQWNEHIQAAVNELPERQRMVLLMHVNEELTYKKIAERCGLTYRIVLRDLTRAYSTLRSRL